MEQLVVDVQGVALWRCCLFAEVMENGSEVAEP